MSIERMNKTACKSAECGFEDASYFCRVFHRKFGITPEQFRLGKNYKS